MSEMSETFLAVDTSVSGDSSSGVSTGASTVELVQPTDAVSPTAPEASATLTDTSPATEPEASGETDDAAGTTPAVEDDDLSLGLDTESLDEKVRNAFIRTRQEVRDLKSFRQQLEPVQSALQARGGWEAVERDLGIFDAAFAKDPQTRATFHEALYTESPKAYQRFISDIISDSSVQQSALQSLGLNPEMVDLYRQVTESGQLPANLAANTTQFDPDWLSQIKPEFRSLLSSLDPEYQADLALRDPKVANLDLEMRAKVNSIEQQQQQAAAQEQARAEEQRKAEVEGRKNAVYSGIRNVVKSEIGKLFPGDSHLQEILTNSAEAGLLKSEQGAALWDKIEQAVMDGEERDIKRLTPRLIAEATVQVQQELRDFALLHEKARKYDELMRSQSAGRDVAPANGQQVGVNGQPNIPNPKARGQFAHENILAIARDVYGNR